MKWGSISLLTRAVIIVLVKRSAALSKYWFLFALGKNSRTLCLVITFSDALKDFLLIFVTTNVFFCESLYRARISILDYLFLMEVCYY